MKLWMLATIFTSCGLTVITSCTNEDNPDVTPIDEVEAQLQQMIAKEIVPLHQQKQQILRYNDYQTVVIC